MIEVISCTNRPNMNNELELIEFVLYGVVSMGRRQNVIGQTYGELLIVDDAKSVNGRRQVLVRCSCGKETVKTLANIKSGTTKSCGCLWEKAIKRSNTLHSGSKDRLYRIHQSMKNRCYLKTRKYYKNYGGRGIKVCNEWIKDYSKFKEWALNNGYSDDLTLDRIDVNGNYCPENCRWVDQKTQMRNTRINVYITIGNETKTAIEWCEVFGINPHTAYTRMSRGWDHIEAVSKKPIR